MSARFPILSGSAFAAIVFAIAMQGNGHEGSREKLTKSIQTITPPESGFYSKKLDYDGIPIKAHAVVADDALRAGRERLQRMLEHCPNIRHNLAEWGAELHIIGKNQVTSDLPEHRHLKGKPFDGRLDVDQRSRGLGGIQASCGEENLLGLPGDRYAGRDICVHEFAHTIRAYGLSSNLRKQLVTQFERSTGQGLWKNAYAATNDDEFFAELSMWYFGTQGDTKKLSPRPVRGREGLRRYDREAFDLLDSIYSGRAPVARINFVKLTPLAPAQEASVRSGKGTAHSPVLFVNRTSQDLQIFWLDFQGKRKFYAMVPAGKTNSQNTFATHAWLVADKKGQGQAIFVAESEAGKAVISDLGKP